MTHSCYLHTENKAGRSKAPPFFTLSCRRFFVFVLPGLLIVCTPSRSIWGLPHLNLIRQHVSMLYSFSVWCGCVFCWKAPRHIHPSCCRQSLIYSAFGVPFFKLTAHGRLSCGWFFSFIFVFCVFVFFLFHVCLFCCD